MKHLKALGTAVALTVAVGTGVAQTTRVLPQVVGATNYVGADIPDFGQLMPGAPGGVTNTIHISNSSISANSLTVQLTMTCDYAGDYYATLTHNGQTAVLLNRVGRGSGDEYDFGYYSSGGFDVTFSQIGGSPIGNDIHFYENPAFSATYNEQGQLLGEWAADGRELAPDIADPSVSYDTAVRDLILSDLFGDANGDWTLILQDFSGLGAGKLESWGITAAMVPEPSTCALAAVAAVGLGFGLLRRRRHS